RRLSLPCSTFFPYTTLFRSRLAGVALIDEGDLHGATGDLLNFGGQLGDLGPLLFVGRRDRQGQQISQRIHGHMHLRTLLLLGPVDRKSTRLNSSHVAISYAV